MTLTPRDLLDAAARTRVADDLDLFPILSSRLGRPTVMQRLRARPALAAIAGVLAFALLSGAAYAVGRSLGYIPGIGLVEPGPELRVLAAPAIVERDGITLTVTQGLASADRTVIAFRVEDIPESALARDSSEGETPPPSCSPRDALRLPDGTTLALAGGEGGGWRLGFEMRDVFGPLPAGVNEATLLVPCLLDTAPGRAPENWEVPLVFVPAPPDMTVFPVIEITPSAAPTVGGPGTPEAPVPSPISIERAIELEDNIILIGSFHSIETAGGLRTSPYIPFVRISDARGNDVAYEYVSDIDLAAGDESTSAWAYSIVGKDQAWPLTFTVDTLDAVLPGQQGEFDFDTGPSPQPGQDWAINQDLDIGGHPLRVLSVVRTPNGYSFSFQGDGTITGVGVDVRGSTSYIAPSGGGGGGGPDGSLGAGVSYAGAVPEGRLTVFIQNATVAVPGPWSIQWQPEDASGQTPTTSTPAPAACVTDETWAQSRAAAAAALPSGLPGRFFVFGPNPDGAGSGISSFLPANGSRTFLAAGSWPVVSPDGAQVAIMGDEGLEVIDLATGVARPIPGTDPTDYRMAWSPDGSRLAFIRSATNQILAVDADGSNPRTIRDNSAVYHALVGWADADHLLITEPGPQGVIIQSLDLTAGSTKNLFAISSNKADTVVSPNGQWIAYTTSLGGMLGNGLYVSRLDGSQRRLVAALDGRALYFPVWSPDNRWLILGLPDPGDPVDRVAQALVNLDTCAVIPLPDVGGEVYSWGRTEDRP